MHHRPLLLTMFAAAAASILLVAVTLLMPGVAAAECTPNYGLKWVNHVEFSNVFKTQSEVEGSILENYFDPNLPTLFYIHGGIALFDIDGLDDNAMAGVYMTPTSMADTDKNHAATLRTWASIDDSTQYNLAFFDWKELSIDHYQRLTAKIWGADSQNWDEFDDPMRYWCSETGSTGFSNDNAPIGDVMALFFQEYKRALYLYDQYGGTKETAQISILGNSMGSHIANRFAAKWKYYKLHSRSRIVARYPLPTRVILTDPVLHIRHLALKDLEDGVRDIDLGIIDRFVEKYIYNIRPYNELHAIDTEIVKTTMPALIDETGLSLHARKRYREMVESAYDGNAFQVYSHHPNPSGITSSAFDECVSNALHLGPRWDEAISAEFLDSYCGWKVNHVRPIGVFFLKELFINDITSPGPAYDLCDGTTLADFSSHSLIRYVPSGVPDANNDGCFEACNINWPTTGSPYANSISCTTYGHDEFFGYSDVTLPNPDPHPRRCGYSDERWMLGMHSEDYENGGCGSIRYPDRYAGGDPNSQLLLGTDMGISVFIENHPDFGGEDVTFFYMGDTWAKDGKSIADPPMPAWCSDANFDCHVNAVRNDAIAVSTDGLPDDGVDVMAPSRPISDTDQPETFESVAVASVHGTETWDPDFWENETEWRFTTPAGAVVVPQALGYQNVIVSWYLTAGFPRYSLDGTIDDGCTLATGHCSDAPSGRRPTSWAAFSIDGFTFESLYQDGPNFVPFSEDGFEWDNCADQLASPYGFDSVAKFAGLSPMHVSYGDLKRMCLGTSAYDATSPMCHPAFLSSQGGGILAYGAGRPATKAPLYLAYIPTNQLGEMITLDPGLPDVPKVYYFNGVIDDTDPEASWSHYEAEAAPLPYNYWGWNVNMGGNPAPCDTLDELVPFDSCTGEDLDYPPEHCLIHFCTNVPVGDGWYIDCDWTDATANAVEQNVFGLMSSRVIRNEGATTWNGGTYEPPIIALLYNETSEKNEVDVINGIASHYARPVRFRSANLSRPWNFSPPSDPLTGLDEAGLAKPVDGYGPFIMDRYTAYNTATHLMEIWYVVSSWDPTKGAWNNSSPYGVYTRKNTFHWPPPDLPGF